MTIVNRGLFRFCFAFCTLFLIAGASSRLVAQGNGEKESTTFSPANYIRIYEDTGTKRILIYDPTKSSLRSSQIKVDSNSTIYIQISEDLIDPSIPMNHFFITATLARGEGESKSLEVIGYSEVGKSQEGAESQNAVLLQTAANVQRTLINMFYTTDDLIQTFFGKPNDCPEVCQPGCKKDCSEGCPINCQEGCPQKLARNPQHECGKEWENADKTRKEAFLSKAKERFRLYKPEISAIAKFFVSGNTARVAGILGMQAFDVDLASLKGIAQNYQENVSALFDPEVTAEKQESALKDLVERTKLIWHDFSFISDEIEAVKQELTRDLESNSNSRANCICEEDFDDLKALHDAANDKTLSAEETRVNKQLFKSLLETQAINCYSLDWGEEITGFLKRYLVPAQIFLGKEDAKPGDTVTLRIEASESAGNAMGIPAQFMLLIRDRSTRVAVSPSLFFIKRLDVDDLRDTDITNPDAIKAVDFSPFPGITLGAVFHSRGLKKIKNTDGGSEGSEGSQAAKSSGEWHYEASETVGSRLLGALAPGIGLNVTFMNFGDPRDFDPSANNGMGAFTTTSGTNFEIGSGIVGSLFNNNLQFTYGYNLNARRKNSYFGIGFGFIEVGKRLAGFLKQ